MRIKLLRHGDCKRLAEHFGCSTQSISYALNFKRNSMKDKEIRHYAMNEACAVMMG